MAGGLFDSGMFNSGAYSGDGGWLSALLQHPEIQAAMQQGAGLPQPPQAPALPPAATIGAPPPVADPAALPQNSSPTMGQMTPQVAPQPAPQQAAPASGPDFGDRLMAGFQGFVNSGSPLGALGNLVGGLATGQRSDPMGMRMQGQDATYKALIAAGVPGGVARAAALNPEVLKTVAGAYFDTKPVLQKTGTDPLSGQDSFSWVQPGKMAITPAIQGGVPLAAGGATAAGGQAPPPSLQGVLDGIEQGRAAGLSQDQLLQTVPNSLRSGVDAMLKGNAIPSNLSMRGQARDLTLRLAHAIDPTFDETMIPGRTAFSRGMSETSPNSPGGQKLLLNTALQHAAEAGGAAAAMGNSDGPIPNVWGGALVAHGINGVNNSTVGGAAKANALADISQKLSGEVGKLYSGNSGGGEAERQATAARFDAARSPQEFAAALEATRNLILDKLNSLQNQRDQVYGASGERVHPFIDPQTKVALDKIDTTIQKLRSGGAPAAPATAAGGISEGATATNPQTGAKVVFKGGQWIPAQ